MFRTQVFWHRESNNRQAVGPFPEIRHSANPINRYLFRLRLGRRRHDHGRYCIQNITASFSHLSEITAFLCLRPGPAWTNLGGSHWLNVKVGKFELDEPISQERMLILNNTGGAYYNYFFTPPGDRNFFGGIGF